ncbi:target of rapamycin complex 2 subunit MAPKAP1-like isoform X3 [Daktulosphaira vitifoliae]|nr:target of rapamycin complex 2 subunit MAPKAP1-like isoform X3 [Daktulosphaira vitifoliae]
MGGDNILQSISTSKYDTYPGIEDLEEEDDIAESLDIHTEFGVRRQRSHTSVQLERLQRNMIKSANVRHIKWELAPVSLTDEEKAELFPKKDISNQKKSYISELSKQLNACPYLPLNPFREYSKYDGNTQLGEATRKYGIFITMLNLERRNYPMQVSIIATAKVHHLIGLVCWKCTIEYPDCTLKDSVNCYALYIAEDDGEVDFDFPCLDSRETVAKFGFGFLAIVERDNKLAPALSNNSPTSQEGNLTQCDNISIKAQQQLEGELNKLLAIEAPLYQLYNVNILNKVKAKTEIHLGISGQKIELDPVVKQRSSSKFPWSKQKPATYDMDCVVACDLTETKSNNRAVFRLVYDSTALCSSIGDNTHIQQTAVWSNFKHHDFEAEQKIAEEIVQKINNILELRCSVRRQEYISLRERKSHRRRSFHLGPR